MVCNPTRFLALANLKFVVAITVLLTILELTRLVTFDGPPTILAVVSVPELAPARTQLQSVPTVERTILKKLHHMQQEVDPDYIDSSYRHDDVETEHNPDQWPPLVIHIPESPPRTPYASHLSRFLLPLRIPEQESKARIHLLELVRLATELGRTLVLPNVGKSRVGACLGYDFATYYDVDDLYPIGGQEGSYLTRYTTLTDFRRWLGDRRGKVQGQIISVSSKALPSTSSVEFPSFNTDELSVQEYPPFLDDPVFLACLSNRFNGIKLTSFTPLHIYPTRPGNGRYGKSLVDYLLQDHAVSPDVLVVNWDLRHPIFPKPENALNSLSYSSELVELARNLAPSGPYLAVHWRMETVPHEVLSRCAHALVDTLSNVLTREVSPIEVIWFATDYPHPIRATSYGKDTITKSGTFRDVGEAHHDAIGVVRDAFASQGRLGPWKVTELSETLERHKENSTLPLEDSGIMAIADKLVAMNAMLFISGAKGCAKSSSYTKQVIEARKARNPLIHNVVQLFGGSL